MNRHLLRLKRKVWLMTWVPACAAVVMVGCGTQTQPQKPTYQKFTIEQAISKVDFKVRQPTYLPFTVTDKFAEIGSLGGTKEVVLIYENKSQQKMLILTESNQHVPAPSDGNEKSVKLQKGTDAVYKSYDILNALFLWPDGESYVLQSKQGPLEKTKPLLSEAELIKVADSVK